MKIKLVGPAYTDSSVNFDAQRCINQYPVKSESGDSKSIAKLQATPGLILFAQASIARTRGSIETNGRAFFVIGNKFVEVHSNGTTTEYAGTILTDVGFVSMATNFTQVCFVDGPNGYIFTLANTINTLLDPTFDVSADWTAGSGWAVSGGVGTATGAISTALSTTPTSLIAGVSYSVTYTINTRSAGSLTVSLGGTAGTPRSVAGTYTETIVAGSSNTLLSFTGTGFTGVIDNASVTVLDSLVRITNAYFLGATTVTFLDQYFVFTKPNSGTYYISALGDGSTGDPTQFANAEANPDNLVGGITIHQEVWLFGTESIEPVYDSGNLAFPLSPIQGSVIEYGCAAAGSIAKASNTVFWLGSDKEGGLLVWMANGSQPQRISNFGVEFAINEMTNPSDCTAFTYSEDGHYFYVMNFTTDNQTWVFDVDLNAWHERLAWNQSTGKYERHWAESHIFCFGKHLVGDYQTGNIYQLTSDAYDDAGTIIRRERTSQYMSDDLEYLYVGEFKLDMQTGVGLSAGAPEDMDPKILVSWSDDGGHKFRAPRYLSVGKAGEYNKRVVTRQCGRARQRIWKVVYTARTKYTIVAAHANPEPGLN